MSSYQRKPESYQWKLESYQWKHLRVSRFGAHTASCARGCAAQYLTRQWRWSRPGAGQCHRGWSHAAEMMTEEIDWAKVALDYRNTDIPLRELARRHGVSHSGILRRAKRDRWGPRQVAGTPPADVKLPAETGKLPVETPSRIEICRARGLLRSWVRSPVFDPPVAVEPHRRRFLAVVVFMIGALAMATSGTATIWYAAHQISNLPQQLTAAGFSAVFELGNASLLAGASALYARRHWACVPIAGLWVISFGFCIFTAAAFMASTIGEGQAQRARVLSHTTAVGEKLSRLRAERAVIAETRSLEMLDVAKRDAIERYPLAAKLSDGCRDPARAPLVCAAARKLDGAAALAAHRDAIDLEIDKLGAQLAELPAIAAAIDPAGDALAAALQWVGLSISSGAVGHLRLIMFAACPILPGPVVWLAAWLWRQR